MEPVEWIILIIALLAAVYVYATMPSPPSKKPPALTDFQVPTAEDGREIMWVFGEVWIHDNNVLWYGALYTTPVQESSGK